MDIVEQSGLMIAIGDWVLKTACQQLAQISDKQLVVCVNVSPRQFEETNFVDKVMDIFAETGVNPHRVCMEITEGMLMQNIDSTITKMRALSTVGVSFSIDDFGTGYSSLTYLKRLPVTMLKIDKSFVGEINSDPNDAVIVETIIAMAMHMHIDVVAEGVENKQTMASLKRMGCRKFQGYYFGHPEPLDELLADDLADQDIA
jgi:EAL domain-containing protein (putative c-di-GMP-specific phosphodiesterase class I)